MTKTIISSYVDREAGPPMVFNCTKCEKREFQLTQMSEMRLLAECVGCGASFIMDSISEKKPRVEAVDPNQHLLWDWHTEKWIPAKRP